MQAMACSQLSIVRTLTAYPLSVLFNDEMNGTEEKGRRAPSLFY